ncbi:hypothetical protein FRACYDRAFT_236875 [Fragilariopsis cylindrus CCMP1102]|uniref:Methyltransferase domain-containing protein n=1 Tax=Fragilariopsis cylindrus CCMP1102 TaxID=635003 RepID=A0A1E7FKD5_9STRA|nr:hypothetical protein FRACYDRAFT_236875 [Fragilariopsis cylindrus CCMP1102]|eukprot:OEU18597.1 hypothetical protein FRACYDRAFT_236875 [Fragilariopsis cylindrus CCMP1102]
MKIRGWIKRKRSMGKNLAFADLLIDESDNNNYGPLVSTSVESTSESPQERKIELIFQRGIPEAVWDDVNIGPTSNQFPTKKVLLPYGALVFANVCEPAKDTKMYRVISWEILKNPKEEAIVAAKQGLVDGVSCSVYLKARADEFYKLNPGMKGKESKKMIESTENNKNNSNSNTKRSDQIEDQFSHGTNKAKGMRATIFASWMIETYGRDKLATDKGVLDVAGGKGKLSIQLALQGKIQSTIIDPLVRKHGEKLDPIGAKRIRKAQAPHPTLLSKEFNQTTFLSECENLIKESSILVGLHPDEPTEDILDIALKYDKNCAIVPCCVFPCFFPLRTFADGRFVRTYDEFLEYLLSKDDRLRKHTLPFQGRNTVIYLHK